LTVSIKKDVYEYEYSAEKTSEPLPVISREKLTGPKGVAIIDRNRDRFVFNGSEVPKLSPITSGINLLKEEPLVKPVYDGFGSLYRRSFFGADLSQAVTQTILPKHVWEALKKADLSSTKDFGAPGNFYQVPLAMRFTVLKNKYPIIYKNVCESFISVFPNIREVLLKTERPAGTPLLGDTPYSPTVLVREKGVSDPVPLSELSSGMQKVLLLIVDLLTLPEETIYMVDEYENSLGINAINFLPEFLDDFGGNRQFVLTTHHPYLINKIPVQNWFVFSRQGANVSIRPGEELERKYAQSSQEAFTQLINDPVYFSK